MPEESVTVENLSAPLRRQVQALRRPVVDAARQFGHIRERLTDLAPKVIKLFTAIQAEHAAYTFVAFARLFDPSIPTHAADRDGKIGYRNHRVYYTLAYMRRLVQLGGNRRRGQQGVRDSATDALARTLATILQVVAEPESVWNAIQTEFGFSERLMTRLKTRVSNTQPLFKLAATKPAKVGDVIHMESTAAPAAEGEPLTQPGRNVSLNTSRKHAA